MKNIVKNLPEYALMGLAVFSFVETLIVKGQISYLMIVVLTIMAAQVVFKNRYLGIFIGLIMGLVSFGLFLAVLSDYRKFPEVTTKAIELITVGSLLSLTGAILAAVMIFKYFNQEEKVAVTQ
ncbi:hypothetical protein [Flavobacterium sp. WV_118_3]|jgi:hypothetical protein|uniref:hypothetical protein n=1 Tax=Flavobacterium sp. WV_118_3 TaxID=3151764 RepID=UPI0032190541